jgi:hypothetical protein
MSSIREKIANSIDNSEYGWRTVRGISMDIGEPENRIATEIVTSSDFVQSGSLNSKGEALFTTRNKYKKITPMLMRVLGAAANSIVG